MTSTQDSKAHESSPLWNKLHRPLFKLLVFSSSLTDGLDLLQRLGEVLGEDLRFPKLCRTDSEAVLEGPCATSIPWLPNLEHRTARGILFHCGGPRNSSLKLNLRWRPDNWWLIKHIFGPLVAITSYSLSNNLEAIPPHTIYRYVRGVVD
jgi:hypothetical protein